MAVLLFTSALFAALVSPHRTPGASVAPVTRTSSPLLIAASPSDDVLPSPGSEAPPPLDSPLLTRTIQGTHVACLLGAVLAPAAMDGIVATMWNAFDSQALTHLPLFEATLAVSAFVVFIFGFEVLHLVLPDGGAPWRLDGKPPLRPLANFGPAEAHKSIVPAVAYLASIWIFQHCQVGDIMLPEYLFGPKPVVDEAPSYFRLVSEVSLGVFLYDLLFFPIHLSFHMLRSPSWRSQHQRHHRWAKEESEAHNAVETIQNSYLDSGIQVAINIAVQHVSPWGFKHPLSRAIHNLLVVYLLTESHSGYDLAFQSHRVFPFLFGGTPRHEQHHQRGGIYFHQFFKWADDLFGFVPPPDRGQSTAKAAAPLPL